VSFPPHAERDVIARAITVAIARFLTFDCILILYSSSPINLNSPSPS
jgi:hypothetical protein